jgi:acyl-CoA synthetase (AMP-forming)/AMP-acid ligase II
MKLLEALEHWVNVHPTKTLYSYLNDTGDVSKSVTYAQLNDQSSALARHLREELGCQHGDRVLLVYPPSLDFIIGFYACIKAGVIAVPTFPPDPTRLNKDVNMFSVITKSCGANVALTSSVYNYATKVSTFMSSLSSNIEWPSNLKWVVTDSVFTAKPLPGVEKAAYSLHNTAFLQYTSGSTSEPKGVIITQESLGHNLKLIITGLAATDDTIVVSWLPQYHDMGLIGSMLGAMFCGGCGFYMSPLSFIKNPNLWIKCISDYRGTHMQAPNFAYTLCARKFLLTVRNANVTSWASKVDLSCVRHMINAAEPVEASTVDSFYAVFGKYGLRHGVIFPTYGLAEHTVYVCSNGKQRLFVDKVCLEKDRHVKLLADSDTAYRAGKDDTTPAGRESNGAWIVGCGFPKQSEGLKLTVSYNVP